MNPFTVFKRVAALEKEVSELRRKKSSLEVILESKLNALDVTNNVHYGAIDFWLGSNRVKACLENLADSMIKRSRGKK
jgi:hypothetical protein